MGRCPGHCAPRRRYGRWHNACDCCECVTLTKYRVNPKGTKLDDEQIRRFICDGVVVLDSGVAPEVHQRIYDKIQWCNTHEFNMGNNVLPRVAELQQVLDAPAVRGALASVLGDGYLLHPHRFMHASEPLDEEERNLSLARERAPSPHGQGINGKQRLAPGWPDSARPGAVPTCPESH